MADSTSNSSAAPRPAAQPAGVTRASTLVRLGAAAVLLITLASWLGFLWRSLHAPVGQYDFSSFYSAALALRLHRGADIYSAQVLAAAGARAQVQVQPPLPYAYPPLMALVLSPFTVIPFRLAARLFLLVNAGLCLILVALLASEAVRLARLPLGTPTRGLRVWWDDSLRLVILAVTAAVVLSAAPTEQTILTGQIDLLVLLPLACVPALLRGRRDAWAGACVGIAAMLKLTPALLLLYFVLRGRWKALWAALATLAALSLLSMVAVGPATFFASIPAALQVGSGDSVLGQNEALVAPIIGNLPSSWPAFAPLAHAAAYAILATLALLFGWVLLRVGRPQTAAARSAVIEDDILAYGIALCGLLVLVPTAWVHHYVWVLPAVVLAFGALVATAWTRGLPSRAAMTLTGLLLVAAVLIDVNLPHAWDTEVHPAITTLAGLQIRPLVLEVRALGTLLVASVLAVITLRARKTPSALRDRSTHGPAPVLDATP